MIYRIVEYIQPWEIDDFERQIDQLIKSSYYLHNSKNVIIDCTMNLDIVEWKTSKIPKEYFLDKFKCIESRANNRFSVEFDIDSSIRGVTAKRRSIQTKYQNYVIWLDPDLYFSTLTLPYLISASAQIIDTTYILTPQIIKYWDSSWDCIVAEKYINQPFNHRDFFDSYILDHDQSNDISVKLNKQIKFGGGWFNLFTDDVFKKIPIPVELTPYGPDDTYISHCGIHINIPQYILSNVVVTEIGEIYSKNKNYIKPLMDIKIKNKEKITDQTLNKLINTYISTTTF
jgi:hypothetical protein